MNISAIIPEYLHKRRIAIAKRYIKGDVLDIGCGSAEISKILSMDQRYIGVDLNIGELNKKYQHLVFYQADMERDKINIDHKYDTILMLAFIEHIRNSGNVFEQCYKLLKGDGIMIITTPTPLGDKTHTLLAKFGLTCKSAVDTHYSINTILTKI